MAKRKTVKVAAVQISSWDEADTALRELSIKRTKVQKAIADYNEKEQSRRAHLASEIAPIEQDIEAYELGLKNFAATKRLEFGKTKSRTLMHGILGFRNDPPSIKQIKGITVDAAIKLVKASKWAWRFIRQKDELNKEEILAAIAAKDLTLEELTPLGLSRHQEEQFFYELKLAVEEKS